MLLKINVEKKDEKSICTNGINVGFSIGVDRRDYTSSYMSCKSSNGRSYTVEVMGAKSKTDEWAYDVGSPAYRFSEGYTYYMTNYVKEKKYTYATIMATPNSSGHFAATGYWSPDSI